MPFPPTAEGTQLVHLHGHAASPLTSTVFPRFICIRTQLVQEKTAYDLHKTCSSSHLVSFAWQTCCHDLTSSLVSWGPKSIHPPEGLVAGIQGVFKVDLRS